MDFSGDGSGFSEIDDKIVEKQPISTKMIDEDSLVSVSLPQPIQESGSLWNDVVTDIQKEASNSHVKSILNHINSDGLPEQFRRLTGEYLQGIIRMVNQRLGEAPFNRHMAECTDRIPEQFYRVNYEAYNLLRSCPQHCVISDIGVKYVNSVQDLVLQLFACLDQEIHPAVAQ